MISDKRMIHAHALVETDQIGSGTHIWAFTHVLKGAVIGQDCNIGDHCFIEGGVEIGNGVVIKNGVSVWDGVIIEDLVFAGPNVTFTNDLIPRAKVYKKEYEKTFILEGASIGANATILCGITLGRWCVIGAGSVVTTPVPDYGLVYGNPARMKGYFCKCGKKLDLPVEGEMDTRCVCDRTYTLSGKQVRQLVELR